MRIVIVEDEYMIAKRLKRFVETSFSEPNINIQVFDTLDDASDYLAESTIDVLFLDLNLNGHDGFDLLKQQVICSFHTIVVSANTDRAIEAFDIGILDFVSKPFTQERIQKAVNRLLSQDVRGNSQYLSYRKLGEITWLPIDDVMYLKASGHYCEVITTSGNIILHDKNLDKLLQILPNTFERIHRSYAVVQSAMYSIKSEEGSKYWLILKNGVTLPIGRTRVKWLKNKLV